MLWCSPQRVCNGGANRDRPKCEPVPDHTQDLSCIVVRAYKRSCEHVDPVIKIGRRSTFLPSALIMRLQRAGQSRRRPLSV